MSEVICSTSEARCFRYLDKLTNEKLSSVCTTNISYEILDVACGPSAGIFAGLPHTNEPMKPTIPLCAGAGAGGADARADAGVDEDEDDDEDAGAGAGASAGSSAGAGAADEDASADVDEDEDEDDAGAGFSRNQRIIESTN